MIEIYSNCYTCKHYQGKMQYAGLKPYPVCRAFPNPMGIPEDIFEQRIDHTVRYEGDGGITYERIPEDLWEENNDD